MLTRTCSIGLFFLFGIIAVASPALAGDPAPPPGPISPTMASLEDVAGRCVNDLPGDATAVHVITEPGNYRLCDDVTCEAGKSGVAISLVGLPPGEYGFSLDLNGHTIQGVAGSLHGVHARPSAASTYKWVQVGGPFKFDTKSGSIINTGAHGIYVEGTGNTTVSGNLHISGTGGSGISADDATTFTVSGVLVDASGNAGISVTGTSAPIERAEIDGCLVTNTTGHGISIDQCRLAVLTDMTVAGASGDGIHLAATDRSLVDKEYVDNCVGNAIYCEGGSVTSSELYLTSNGGSGLVVSVNNPPSPAAGEPVGGINVSLEQDPGGNISGNGGSGVLVTATNFPAMTPGEPVGGINVSLEQKPGGVINGNGDDGVTIEFDDTVSPRVRLRNVTTGGNGRHGFATVPFVAGAFCDVVVDDSDASFNAGGGLVVHGSLEIEGSTCNDNGGNGIDHTMGADTGLYLVIAGETVCNNNGGDGLSVVIDSGATDASCRVTGAVTNGNTLQGFRLNDSSSDDVSVELEYCSANNNGTGGIDIDMNTGASYKKSTYKSKVKTGSNAGIGISVNADEVQMNDCSMSANTGDGGVVIADAVRFVLVSATNNGGDGIDLAPGNPTEAQFANLIDSHCSHNGGRGTVVTGFSLSVSGGSYCNNGSHGLLAQDVDGNAGLDRLSASGNIGDGIRALDVTGALTINDAICSNNGDNGISVTSSGGTSAIAAEIQRCVGHANGVSGISVSSTTSGRITECSAFSNGSTGIELLSFSHVLTNNMCGNNTGGNYSVLLPGNTVGSLVDETNIDTEDNTTANFAP